MPKTTTNDASEKPSPTNPEVVTASAATDPNVDAKEPAPTGGDGGSNPNAEKKEGALRSRVSVNGSEGPVPRDYETNQVRRDDMQNPPANSGEDPSRSQYNPNEPNMPNDPGHFSQEVSSKEDFEDRDDTDNTTA